MVRLLAVVLSLGLCSIAAAAPQVQLSAPATLRSDSSTTLRVEADQAVLDRLVVQADAGTVAAPRRDGTNLLVDFQPPQVAAARVVQLAVLLRGRCVARAAVQITAVPPVVAEQQSTGPFGLRGPSMVVLGVTTSATIRATSPRSIELAVNVGSLSVPARGSDGVWHATYTPPVQHFPQVAIVTVRDQAGQVDWLRIPLYGVGRVDTRTRPNSQITLAIAGMTFGPFRSNERGLATNSVIAPPGIRHGITRAMDSSGNGKDTPFDLGTPPFLRLASLCVGDSMRVFAVGPDGAATVEAPVLSVDHGALEPLMQRGPGQWQARWRPGPRDVSERPEARLGDERTKLCAVNAPADPPSRVELRVDHTSYIAGSGPIRLVATLVYPGPRPPLDVPVELHSDLGPVEIIRREGQVTSAILRPNDHFGSRMSAVITARVAAPLLSSSVEVALHPGPPAHLLVHGPTKKLDSDGTTSAPIIVTAEDAAGNPTKPNRLISSGDGQLSPGEKGVYLYSTPRGNQWTDRVTFRDPLTGASATLVVGLQRPVSRFLVAARVGYLTNFGKLSAPLIALDAAYRPSALRRRLSIGLEAGFYQAEVHGETSMVFIGIPLLARLGYSVPIGRAALYGGVGTPPASGRRARRR